MSRKYSQIDSFENIWKEANRKMNCIKTRWRKDEITINVRLVLRG
jgi:hypothetical protein